MYLLRLSLGNNGGRVKKANRVRRCDRTAIGTSEKTGGCILAKDMAAFSLPLRAKFFRSYLAVAVCLALLYFASGGSFLHQHVAGQDPVCHVCQSLHAPVLATAAGLLVAAPEIAGWHDARPIQTAAFDEVSLHHAGRASTGDMTAGS